MENRNKSAQRFISDTAASIAPPVHTHIPTTYNKTAWPEGRSARRGNGLSQLRMLPLLAISSALKSQKLYYQKLKTIFPTLLSQKRNILLRRKQLLKKSIQQHRIYKSYKSKSKEKPAACIQRQQFQIMIGHIHRQNGDHSDGKCGRKMHEGK